MTIQELRQKKAAKTAEARALLANVQGTPNADEAAKFAALQAEVIELEAQEARQQFLDDAERRQAGTVIAGNGGNSFGELETRVSLQRILQAGLEQRSLSGAEAEYHAEILRRSGPHKEGGVYAPMRLLESRANTAANNPELVGTDHRPDQYIGALRANLLTRRLGVRVLGGLTGNVSIPKRGTGVVAGFVAADTALNTSDMTHDPVTLAPKHAGCLSEIGRSLILQGSPDVEQLLRDDMSATLAAAIDRVTIAGGGANEPDGVTATLAAANATFAGPTWAEVLEVVKDVEIANALGAHNWLLSPAARAKFAGTLKVAGDAGAGFLLQDGKIGDYAAYSTNQMPNGGAGSGAIFGDWSQAIVGYWDTLSILVNPYSEPAYSRGGVMVRAMTAVDVAIRHAEAFQWADAIPA